MDRKEIDKIIQKYIKSYNSFDINGIVNLLNEDIEFRNISSGVINAETSGIQAFKGLAEQSAEIFSQRCQRIIECKYRDDRVKAEIDYEAIIAKDLPNGLKAGDKIQLRGQSIFKIKNGKLSLIEDHS
ncbi:nuclear transport factor 2 family protein [Paenibacillus endoradicis]|uniref:nuclear transport factor 2 family protein n=1 Tax=Paenibacillus endoradicis TaxID=2972487 RepID=UPI0021590689|nr:nuclear transport factor 2 family protein [Paenibacillus endoradicis]MCR8656689.1 nuclear transport factor 2 family protein [Paenibacillus endoradicis]